VVLPNVSARLPGPPARASESGYLGWSSGRPVVFGDTSTGRHLMVVYEETGEDTVYPVTAYEVPRRQQP